MIEPTSVPEPAHADRQHASCDATPELFDPLPLDDLR
jgi:hypothetical protein